VVSLFIILSCGNSQKDLSNHELLTRLSIDLRGHRPSLDELNAASKIGWSKEDIIDEFINSPEFPRQMAHFFAPIYNTRQDETLYPADNFQLPNEYRFAFSVGDEPIRIIEEVISNDLAWPTIVTSNWTMVNEDLASIYSVDYPDGESGWKRVQYTDGRPFAGVLSTNGLWWRYETSSNNASRARANQISRILLCRDYLDKEVQFDRDIDLSDEEVMNEALQSNPGCVSCHATLDPLASFLGGVFVPRKSGSTEMIFYHPERETIWRDQTGVAPAYYGHSGTDLSDLGRFIAEDPQFAQCTVNQVSEFLLQDKMTVSDTEEIFLHREEFLQNDLNIKSLVKSIVLSKRYQSSVYQSQSSYKVVSPIQIASQIEHLTGFRFTSDGYDMLLSETVGLYSMAGGGDGQFSNDVEKNISVSMLLIQQQLAIMAVDYWVEHNTDTVGFSLDEDYEEYQIEEILQELHLRILGVSVGNNELQELKEYYQLVVGTYDQKTAWKSVLRIIFQDPQMLVY
jgi:hypothetical protein